MTPKEILVKAKQVLLKGWIRSVMIDRSPSGEVLGHCAAGCIIDYDESGYYTYTLQELGPKTKDAIVAIARLIPTRYLSSCPIDSIIRYNDSFVNAPDKTPPKEIVDLFDRAIALLEKK